MRQLWPARRRTFGEEEVETPCHKVTVVLTSSEYHSLISEACRHRVSTTAYCSETLGRLARKLRRAHLAIRYRDLDTLAEPESWIDE